MKYSYILDFLAEFSLMTAPRHGRDGNPGGFRTLASRASYAITLQDSRAAIRRGKRAGRKRCSRLSRNFDRIGEENAFAVLARATDLAAQGRDIINLGIGQPDFRTPEHIVEAAIKALRDGHHGYTPATGIKPLARGGRGRPAQALSA